MVHDHYPFWKMAISLGILTQHFQVQTHMIHLLHSTINKLWITSHLCSCIIYFPSASIIGAVGTPLFGRWPLLPHALGARGADALSWRWASAALGGPVAFLGEEKRVHVAVMQCGLLGWLSGGIGINVVYRCLWCVYIYIYTYIYIE